MTFPQQLEVPFESTALRGETYPDPSIFFCPGAGRIGRSITAGLRSFLHAAGYGSAIIEFIGAGETGGEMLGSSLESRLLQARAMIDALPGGPPRAVFGSSMGAYIAVRLLEYYALDTLVLSVPAMYEPAAFTAPFGPEFSSIIRQPGSWQRSDAWGILQRFRGRLLVMTAELDTVIPQAVIDRILASATSALSVEHIVFEGKPHLYLDNDVEAQQRAAEAIARVLSAAHVS